MMEVGLVRLIGFCVNLALSVLYTVLFFTAMWTLTHTKRNSDISVVVPCILVFMFLLNCAQLCLQATDIYLAFFRFRSQPGNPSAYFLDCSSRILPARDAIFWTLSVLTDSLMCWRLYIIWLKNKYIVILPVCLLAAGLGTGAVMYRYTIGRMLENSMRLSPEIDKWWEVTLGFTLCLNVLVPGLIIGRVWHIARQVGVLGTRALRPYKQIALALMESGIIYTLAIVAWIIIFASNSLPALFMAAAILPTVVAIVPTLIIIRINTFGNDPAVQLRHRAIEPALSAWTNGAAVHIHYHTTRHSDPPLTRTKSEEPSQASDSDYDSTIHTRAVEDMEKLEDASGKVSPIGLVMSFKP